MLGENANMPSNCSPTTAEQLGIDRPTISRAHGFEQILLMIASRAVQHSLIINVMHVSSNLVAETEMTFTT